MTDYFNVFGVTPTTSIEEIQEKIAKIANKWRKIVETSEDSAEVDKANKKLKLLPKINQIFKSEESKQEYMLELYDYKAKKASGVSGEAPTIAIPKQAVAEAPRQLSNPVATINRHDEEDEEGAKPKQKQKNKASTGFPKANWGVYFLGIFIIITELFTVYSLVVWGLLMFGSIMTEAISVIITFAIPFVISLIFMFINTYVTVIFFKRKEKFPDFYKKLLIFVGIIVFLITGLAVIATLLGYSEMSLAQGTSPIMAVIYMTFLLLFYGLSLFAFTREKTKAYFCK